MSRALYTGAVTAPLKEDRTAALRALAERAAAAIAPAAGPADAAQRLDLQAVSRLKESGYPALTVPADLGGWGASLHEFAVCQERLGQADASLALVAAMNAHLLGSLGELRAAGADPSELGWPEAVYAELAGASVTRGALSNSLASEPELGSPSRGGLPATHAEAQGDGWRVTGRKTWSTGAAALDYYVVSAATPQQEVRRFVIPAHAAGVSVEETWHGALALRGSGSNDVVMRDVPVPAGHALPPRQPQPESGAWFWTAVAATYLGVGQAALDALAAYAGERVPTALGRPIATLPKIQQAAGEMQLALLQARALLHHAAHQWSRLDPTAREQRQALLPLLAGAKRACTNAAVLVTDQAMRAAGGAALTGALPLERLLRDARAGLTHPPADDQAAALLGKAVLGEA